MSESTSWTEVRRSTPAEYVRDVPDEATVWACWVGTSRHLTVYSDEDAYYIVLGEDDETRRVIPIQSGDVEEIAAEIRCNWQEYLEGKPVTEVRATLNAGATAQIIADDVDEARQNITDNVVGEVKTVSVNGIDVTVRFDELPGFEIVGGDQA
jgi:hypothetical protein